MIDDEIKKIHNLIETIDFIWECSTIDNKIIENMKNNNYSKANKIIVYCPSKIAFKQFLKKNNQQKYENINCEFSNDINQLLENFKSFYFNDETNIALLNDEMFYSFLFSLFIVGHNHILCNTFNSLINMDENKIETYGHCYTTVINYIKNKIKKEENIDEQKIYSKLYENILKEIFINLCSFINDQISIDKINSNNLDELYISNSSRISSLLNLTDENDNTIFENFNFNNTENETVSKVIDSILLIKSKMSILINKIFETMLMLKSVKFVSVSLNNNNNINIDNMQLFDKILKLLNKQMHINDIRIKNLKVEETILPDLNYFINYNILNVGIPSITIESISEEIDGDNVKIINTFKSANEIFRNKQSMNILINTILDLLVK